MSLVKFNVERPSPKWVLNSSGTLTSGSSEANYPAFEFNTDGSYKGLLVERQSTNLILQSEDFSDTWATSADGIISANTEKTPDGDATSKNIKLVDDGLNPSGTGTVYVDQTITELENKKYTASIFLKANGKNYARLLASGIDGGAVAFQYFDLDTGNLGTPSAQIDDSTIEEYPNGWYRCSITWTQGASDTSFTFRISVANSISSTNVPLDGNSSIFVWGAQLEEGDKATSYIPTSGTADTRTADYIYLNNASQYLPSEGSLKVKADFGESYDLNILGLSSSLAGEKDIEFQYSSTEIKLFVTGSEIQSKTGTFDFSGMDKIEIGNFDSGSQFNRHLQYFAIQ